jgi:hypothetical protein
VHWPCRAELSFVLGPLHLFLKIRRYGSICTLNEVGPVLCSTFNKRFIKILVVALVFVAVRYAVVKVSAGNYMDPAALTYDARIQPARSLLS